MDSKERAEAAMGGSPSEPCRTVAFEEAPISTTDDLRDRRREPRFPIAPGTVVEVTWELTVLRGTTVDRSLHGMLIEFEQAPNIPVGELLVLDLIVADPECLELPYLGVGRVARVVGNSIGIDLDLSHLVKLDPDARARAEALQTVP